MEDGERRGLRRASFHPLSSILQRLPRAAAFVALVGVLWLSGCGDATVDQALDSDANGYVCLACQSKFYTSRSVFATRCPECRKPNIAEAAGFKCETDQFVSVGPRGRRSLPCQKCNVVTTALCIPREADLLAWGAKRRTEAEVTGN